jgi:hypothetical protein
LKQKQHTTPHASVGSKRRSKQPQAYISAPVQAAAHACIAGCQENASWTVASISIIPDTSEVRHVSLVRLNFILHKRCKHDVQPLHDCGERGASERVRCPALRHELCEFSATRKSPVSTDTTVTSTPRPVEPCAGRAAAPQLSAGMAGNMQTEHTHTHMSCMVMQFLMASAQHTQNRVLPTACNGCASWRSKKRECKLSRISAVRTPA